jgi:prolyl-tRNA editing enzyme YbaK/EbsC (Cys-tRNA(Pro) deacylase)
MQPLTPKDVQAAIDELELDVKMIHFEESTATSQLAADQIGCKLGQIVKSLGFMVDGKPILVLASGDGMVDDKKLSKMYGVGRKKIKTAKPEQLIEIWGYEPGGVPPIGHRTSDFPILVDEALKRFEVVYAAGGSHLTIFEVSLEKLVEVTGGAYADVRKDA